MINQKFLPLKSPKDIANMLKKVFLKYNSYNYILVHAIEKFSFGKVIIYSCLLFLFFSFRISAQERQDNAWKAVFLDYSLSTSSTLRLETHLRTRQFFSENDQYLIRPSVNYKIGKYSALVIGYTFLSTNTPIYRTLENNLWQQFNFSIPVKRSTHFGWIRLEQRWQTQNNVKKYGSRVRFRTGFQFPITRSQKLFVPNLVLFNEVFLNIVDNFPYEFNQNWTFMGFQRKFGKKLNLITGFQRITLNKGKFYLHKNIWSSTLFYRL